MHAVVLDHIAGDLGALTRAAAEVMGTTAYDVRACIHAPDGGPAVITVCADVQQARTTRAKLQRAGFHAFVVDVQVPRPSFEVRRFELGDGALTVHDRTGETIELPYAAIDGLVAAIAVTSSASTTTTRQRKLSVARSVLTGGLINTKVETSTKTSRSTESDALLYVYARGGVAPPLRLSERELQYQGLGAAIQPSRAANFRYTVDALRRLCPQARWDARLQRRAAQTQVLGHTLSPDEHLPMAVALVAASVRSAG